MDVFKRFKAFQRVQTVLSRLGHESDKEIKALPKQNTSFLSEKPSKYDDFFLHYFSYLKRLKTLSFNMFTVKKIRNIVGFP